MNATLSRRGFLARSAALAGVAAGTAFPARPASSATARATRHGVHGMVLFGGLEGLYASHMPMFHVPHDVQAVFRVRAADAALDRRLRAALASAAGPWSIEPEPFDLDRAAPGAADPLGGWRADVFEGHFERGGQRRQARVPFVVEATRLFARLDPSTRVAGHRDFLCLGDGREHFLVKRLDQRPDVDLIGRFRTSASGPVPASLRLAGASLQPPSRDEMTAALSSAGITASGDLRWLHAETGDLA